MTKAIIKEIHSADAFSVIGDPTVKSGIECDVIWRRPSKIEDGWEAVEAMVEPVNRHDDGYRFFCAVKIEPVEDE